VEKGNESSRPVTLVHEVAETAPYGQILRARIVLSEPHLALELQDSYGVPLNRVVDTDGLPELIWAAEPAQMGAVGRAFAFGMTRDVAVMDRTAYTAQGLFGMDIFDLSDPSAPEHIDTLSFDVVVFGVEAHGLEIYVSLSNRNVEIYRSIHGALEPVGDVETSKTPIAVRVDGNTLVVAELNFFHALKCFAGVRCWPADVAEVFDITNPGYPVKKAEFDFHEAELLFGKLSGKMHCCTVAGALRYMHPRCSHDLEGVFFHGDACDLYGFYRLWMHFQRTCK
jgi:hypothetical protein